VPTRCFAQIGDGSGGGYGPYSSNGRNGPLRPTPVAVVGLSSGVANVAVGEVRLFVKRRCECCFRRGTIVCEACVLLHARLGGGTGCAVARGVVIVCDVLGYLWGVWFAVE
jgi:hypothetical protein